MFGKESQCTFLRLLVGRFVEIGAVITAKTMSGRFIYVNGHVFLRFFNGLNRTGRNGVILRPEMHLYRNLRLLVSVLGNL